MPIELLDYPMRDTSVTYANSQYLLTGTTGAPLWWHNNTGIQMWSSIDMHAWQPIGLRTLDGEEAQYVWTFEHDATWQKRVPPESRALWAPEIHFLRGTYYIPYSVVHTNGGTGLLRSTSGSASGPYVDVHPSGPLTSEIDASLFEDSASGTVYFLHQNGKIARLNNDLTALVVNSSTLLLAADGHPVGFEGVFAVRYGGVVYLSAARFETVNGSRVYSCHVAASTSGSVLGPFGESYRLSAHCGHNVFFTDAADALWSTMFGSDSTAPFRERPGAFRVERAPSGRLVPLDNVTRFRLAHPAGVARDHDG